LPDEAIPRQFRDDLHRSRRNAEQALAENRAICGVAVRAFRTGKGR